MPSVQVAQSPWEATTTFAQVAMHALPYLPGISNALVADRGSVWALEKKLDGRLPIGAADRLVDQRAVAVRVVCAIPGKPVNKTSQGGRKPIVFI